VSRTINMAIVIDKTISKVVESGLCTGCGTCVGICPEDAIQMGKEESCFDTILAGMKLSANSPRG